jgi:Cyanate lyase C-terminal domain
LDHSRHAAPLPIGITPSRPSNQPWLAGCWRPRPPGRVLSTAARAQHAGVDVRRKPDPGGDRVIVTLGGKFLPYQW